MMKISGKITYTRIKQIGLGQGQNSCVYLADDPQLGGQIAVKEIPKASFGANIVEFFREAKTMFRVAHKNVVPIMCAFQTADKICLAMKLYKKGSLLDQTAANPLRVSKVIRIGQEILAGLSSLHAKKFIHFDIKPSNVLFADEGHAMLADFGQTRPVGPTGIAVRPPLYIDGIPPECYSGIGANCSDIYQLGITLYRASNGDEWFDAQRPSTDKEREERILSGKFPRRDLFLPHIPRRLQTVIRKALSVDPDDRYQTPSEFADDLAHVEITHDWSTSTSPSGEVFWRCERCNTCDLLVHLKALRSKKWGVAIYSRRNGKTRKYRVADWRSDLTRMNAMKYLRTFFRSL